MRSLRSRHIWLIQPNEPLPPVMPIDVAGGDSVRFSPSWDLLCLQAFILGRTGHTCELIDLRLYETTAAALGRLADHSNPGASGIAVIYATVQNLGPVASAATFIHDNYPGITISVCGPYATAFPETINLIPHVKYGFCGDPEMILRHFLDFSDIEHRLKLIPGLIIAGVSTKFTPNWAPNLNGLSLPHWNKIRWSTYHTDVHTNGARVEARLSRGNTDTLIDQVSPLPNEPLRAWPFLSMAQLLQKCPRQGISEIFFADSPGFWTPEHILEWCRQLKFVRSTQAWAFQMVPRLMSDAEILELAEQECKRVELIVPSCDPELRQKYGYTLHDDQLLGLMNQFSNKKIKPQLVYWTQGPGERPGESDRILKHINAMHIPQFSVYPFPMHHDSLLYHSTKERGGAVPPLTYWLDWAQHHEQVAPPSLWQGIAGAEQCKQTMMNIKKRIAHSPWVKLQRSINKYLPYSDLKLMLKRFFTGRSADAPRPGQPGNP